MFGLLKGAFALLVVLFVWTSFLAVPILGWSRLFMAARSIFDRSARERTISMWLKDDIMINELLGGLDGHSLSGRVGYHALKTGKVQYCFAQWVINTIFWFQPHHCYQSIIWRYFPVEERTALTERHRLMYRQAVS